MTSNSPIDSLSRSNMPQNMPLSSSSDFAYIQNPEFSHRNLS
jgi:hypothetical protein